MRPAPKVTPSQHTIRQGFRVTPTLNGGWVLTDIAETGYMPVNRGAFTNDDDLIDFIIAQLKSETRQTIAQSDQDFLPSEEVQRCLRELAGGVSDAK